MKSRETKIFTIDNKEMRFNRESFNQAILLYSRKKHMKLGEVEQTLADTISVNIETLRNWRKGSNGPSSETYIKDAAAFLGVSDWTSLFTEKDGGNEMNQMSMKQIEAVKKIYDACVEALNHFLYIENVRSLIHSYELRKKADPEFDVESAAYEISSRMFLAVDQEYFYLRNHEIYDALADLTVDISNEVISTLHDYIGEPDQVESLFDSLSTFADKAMQKLNGIIDSYIPKGV